MSKLAMKLSLNPPAMRPVRPPAKRDPAQPPVSLPDRLELAASEPKRSTRLKSSTSQHFLEGGDPVLRPPAHRAHLRRPLLVRSLQRADATGAVRGHKFTPTQARGGTALSRASVICPGGGSAPHVQEALSVVGHVQVLAEVSRPRIAKDGYVQLGAVIGKHM